jgi:hypothetical protein
LSSTSRRGLPGMPVAICCAMRSIATNQKEFYVSISRGRQLVAIYTTDREALRDHVQRLGDRELALDLDRAR